MLYIDQPNQVGFSYDTLTNATFEAVYDLWFYVANPANFSDGIPESNLTSYIGTFSSQDVSHTTNSTQQAAHALWHFAQTWFSEFPYYKPADDRISLWSESYGGHYGPGFFRFFQQQNDKIANGNSDEKRAHFLHLDTLGIVNGLVDAAIQGEAYIEFAYNNVSCTCLLAFFDTE
jgi:carboxypeptidase C (cathepsin A)